MVTLIIWSKDRACQLELLLRSIDTYTDIPFNVNIIYNASNASFLKAYDTLRETRNANFIHEHLDNPGESLYTKTVALLDSDHVCFAADDNLFYRAVPPFSEWSYALPKQESETFSFRLGLNTVLQNFANGSYQPPLNKYVKKDNTIFWNAKDYHPLHNYGYPLALDLHVFRTSLIRKLVSRFTFKNTNEFESKMFEYRDLVPFMASFKKSVSVNVPLNNISGVTQSSKTGSSLSQLNQYFLDGKRLSLNISQKIIGAHQDIELKYG